MRILFLTQLLPYPLDSGPRVRQYYVLRHLAARHDVSLVCFGRPNDSAEAVAHLRSYCRDVRVVAMHRSRANDVVSLARSLVNRRPINILRDERPAMRRAIAEAVAGAAFDAIHADQLSMAQYGLRAREETARQHRGRAAPLMVVDAHNAYYLIPQRMADVARQPIVRALLRREARLTADYEARTYAEFDHVVTVTPEDLAAIRRLGAFGDRPRFTVMPICVDADAPAAERRADASGILMLGGVHWPPNADAVRWFAREVWPSVRARVPRSQLFIVGARPPADVRALGDFAGIRRPEDARGAPIVVTGYVDDPAPFLRHSAALVAPLRSGGGMRVKIVEALQWGLPVVSTTIGCEGIDVVAGRDLLVADQPGAFAEAVVSVLEDPALAARLSERGRQLVRQRYHWRTVYTALDAIHGSMPSVS